MGRKESVYDTDIIRSVMLCTIILNDTACLRSALRVFTAVKIPFFLCKPSVNGPFTFPVLIDLGNDLAFILIGDELSYPLHWTNKDANNKQM